MVELDAEYKDWTDALHQPSEFLWLTDLASKMDDGDQGAQAIPNGNDVAGSDGSFKLEIGMASWVLKGMDQEDEIKGCC
jgi:hypothetical protein